MTKLCPRGKAAAKRKFRVYPSAYANAYASKICAGKIKDPSGVKRKDFRGRKPAAMGGPMSTEILKRKMRGTGGARPFKRDTRKKFKTIDQINQERTRGPIKRGRENKAGGGLMEATARLKRQGLKEGSKKKKDQGDILGERFDKKFKKLAESKETQLHSKDFLKGVDRAERRAAKEVMQEAGIPMARGGRVMYKSGMRVCKLAKRGKGRAYGKNS